MSYDRDSLSLKNNEFAVALGYKKGVDAAPRVLAKGTGSIAEQILDLAKSNGIHIQKNEELAKILSVMEVNSYIPKEAYEVVAKILSYIYNKKK